jgi:hypothetical protein
MGLLDDVKGMLTQYAAGSMPSGDAGAHFQQVTQSVDSGTLAQGIAAAMRSDQTPPFAQLVSQLFASGSGDQKMAMLSTLLSSVPPEQRAELSTLIPGLGAGTPATPARGGDRSARGSDTGAARGTARRRHRRQNECSVCSAPQRWSRRSAARQ